ncbi:MAG: hypothetical protein HYX75_20235 [Acidobacteria bacterium]|nr:hypothetical protein [Acidobacteriota bacterium]
MRALGIACAATIAVSTGAFAASIVRSRHDITHDLGAYEEMPRYINNYGEVCVYCHTPHSAGIDAPLWNRQLPTGPFQLYASTTMDTVVGQLSGYSLACLSCHDGTIAVDAIINAPGPGPNLGGPWYGKTPGWRHYRMSTDGPGTCGWECHHEGFDYGHDARMSYMGTDMRNDHPVSMTYPTPAQDPDFIAPPDPQKGFADLPLFNGKVECPTCHNVHDPGIKPFLRKSNADSSLCGTCHVK